MSLNVFHLKVGAAIGGAVGITSANMLMITQSFNTASMDWKAAVWTFGGALLGGLGGAAYMSDRTNILPLVPMKSVQDLVLPANRKEVLKPLVAAMLGTAMYMQGYFSDKQVAEPAVIDPPRYELRQ